ncbi:hypothetical protein PVK06_047401 [Gossypium arboreum]|uniref:Uncharacterized protein n=1 Tax=Gossypium arboreum TaxID=29729 RepID=A0ABR0MD84_GOSAR|nr:hypothetical protein PVK06_047401 [Gossypium arboreum]
MGTVSGTILHDDDAQVSSPCKTRLGVDKPSEVVQEKANDAQKNQEDQARTNHEEAFEPTKDGEKQREIVNEAGINVEAEKDVVITSVTKIACIGIQTRAIRQRTII